jgi:hypothetical protein
MSEVSLSMFPGMREECTAKVCFSQSLSAVLNRVWFRVGLALEPSLPLVRPSLTRNSFGGKSFLCGGGGCRAR